MKPLLVLLLCSVSFAGNVYCCKYKSEAVALVYVTDDITGADLVVYVSEMKREVQGKDAVWHFVKYKGQSDIKIYYVKYKSEANLVVFFTRWKSEAGWRKSNFLTGRLQ
jgi:hypothetical protein